MSENRDSFRPVVCGPEEALGWQAPSGLPLLAAKYWNRYVPRAKGAFPRLVGRVFRKHLRHYILTQKGARLAIEPSSLDIYVHLLNHGGVWNKHVFDVCRSLLKPGQVFWDIGVNIGFMSIEMAKEFDDKVEVCAIELLPALARNIAISAALNGFQNLRVFDVMLGDSEGECGLFVGSHSIHASAVAREKGSVRISRSITTLDRLFETGRLPAPHVIKMDIEGGEYKALCGAKAILARFRPHLLFEADENMRRFGYGRREMLALLGGLAPYDFFYVPDTGKLVPVEESNLEAPYSDILASPRD